MSFKKIDDYSFKYSGVMEDAMQSLPLGNGDIGVNVWLSDEGDIHLLFSKTDSWSELYRLLKPAHAVLKLNPCPFSNGADFDLSIADGTLRICSEKTCLQIYVDAFAPCLRLLLKTEKPVDARLMLINYRNKPIDPGDDFSNYYTRFGKYNIVESADTINVTRIGGVAQIHRNGESCYTFSLKNQHMESYIGKEKDPLLGHTFGTGLYSPDMQIDGEGLFGKGLTKIRASVFVKTGFTDCPSDMLDSLDDLYVRYKDESNESYTAHVQSWRKYWERAYIFAEGDDQAEQVTKAFLYQRYMTRCADRGNAPIKFNGSLFTTGQMEGRPGNYDARAWGAPYWFQNTRIIYWYLLYMGDYDSLLPMLDMYLNMVPISKARCHSYFEHDGILIPETVSHFGLYANSNYGFENDKGLRQDESGKVMKRGEPCNNFIKYHYNGMLELSYMMLKYLDASADISRRERMFDFIEQTLLFFDRHFCRVDGKIMMNPVSALETWQICVNDAPDVAGLQAVCRKLSDIPYIPEGLKTLVDDILPAIPEISFENSDEGTVLAPCSIKISPIAKNVENPELYSVFPYELYGIGRDGLEIARRTYNKRKNRHDGGWSQDPVDAALLGMQTEALRHLIRQSAMTDKRALFPAAWGPNFDETPDQCHGGMTSLCLMFMLLQTNGREYTAFPAWPSNWDVRFRLPLNHNVYICAEQIKGKRTVREESTYENL